jgi:GH24 family phage-related lysozyme (muramidase)
MDNLSDLKTDPQEIIDDAVYKRVRQEQSDGKMPLDIWTNRALPLKGWGYGSLRALRDSAPHRPSSEIPAGLQDPNQGWKAELASHIQRVEGNETFAYHGLNSSHRKGGVRATEGHGSTEEVSVGFGFNLTRPGGRDTFRRVLGTDDKAYDDVVNGRRGLTEPEKMKLMNADIDELDEWLTKQTKGHPFREHQRVALLSLAYNAGPTAVAKSGILDLAINGKPLDAANAIKNFRTNGGKLSSRRAFEATRFMGGDAPSLNQR